jgi:hypothetical protein
VFLFFDKISHPNDKKKKVEKEKVSAIGTKVFLGEKMAQNYHHIMTIYFFEVAIF